MKVVFYQFLVDCVATLTGENAVNSASLGCSAGTCTYVNNAAARLSKDVVDDLCGSDRSALALLDANGDELFRVSPRDADAIAFVCINGVLHVSYYDDNDILYGGDGDDNVYGDDEEDRFYVAGITDMKCLSLE